MPAPAFKNKVHISKLKDLRRLVRVSQSSESHTCSRSSTSWLDNITLRPLSVEGVSRTQGSKAKPGISMSEH